MAKQLLPTEIAALERYIDSELLNALKLDPTVPGAENKLLHTFVARKLRWYVENNYFGGRLWEDFQEDFEEWTLDMLKNCEKEVLHCLRDTLARRGVFIPRGKDRRKLYFKLLDTLGEKELHKWTPEEFQAQIDHGGGFVGNYRPPLPKIVPQTKNFVSKFEEPSSNTNLESLNTYNRSLESDQDVKTGNIEKSHPPQLNPYVSSNFAKQLTDLGKLYIDKDNKYGGERYEILDNKLTIFRDYCKKVGLMQDQQSNAFSFMLKGKAAVYYYDQIAEKEFTFEKMICMMKAHFETDEIKMEYLTRWRNTTLASVKLEFPEKKLSECFYIMVEKLQKIQRGLQGSYQMNQKLEIRF